MYSEDHQIETFRREFGGALGFDPGQITLFWKGRIGLYGLLQALEVGPGDEVIVPAFTCVVVSNAILYCGARPVYADVDLRTFNLTPETVRSVWSDCTRVVIGQNTFGLSSDLDALATLCQEKGAVLLEDCTHGFGGHYRGRPNGTVARASFFSSQWNKPFSTGLGGMVACRDEELAARMRRFEDSLAYPASSQTRSLALQLFARRHLLRDWIYWPAVRAYRYFSQAGWVTGSSVGEELTGTTMPPDYLTAFSRVQARAGIRALQNWPVNLQHRRRVANRYTEELAKLNVAPLYIPEYSDHTFLKYPLLVRDRRAFFTAAEAARVPLGDWMLSPIHPITENWDRWAYRAGSNPAGEFLSRHVINLPTDPGVSMQTVARTCRFLQAQQSELMRGEARYPSFSASS